MKDKKVYLVQYINSSKPEYLAIDSSKRIVSGRLYTDKNNRQLRVIRKVKLKYSTDDLKTLANIFKDYDIGTVQYRLYSKLCNIINSNIPIFRSTKQEREAIWDIYNYSNSLSEHEIKSIEKVLNI